MKHIIFGGDGFVGHVLAAKLIAEGETVIVCDIKNSNYPHYNHELCTWIELDVTKREAFEPLDMQPEDAVYNLSAKMLSPIVTRAERHEFFWPVNYHGTAHILEAMEKAGARNLVHFTTDMIYGHTKTVPMYEDHPVSPLGEYGESKWETEKLASVWRAEKSFNISLFRPRLIIGPGRLGILSKLFKLVDYNLPVPMIGSGKNPYQFISVFDCAEAAYLAWKKGFPNEAYNLGSSNPPSVRKLLKRLIDDANSYSILVPTPGWAVKRTLDFLDMINQPIMDPEQYLIADEECLLDCSKAERDLGWKARYSDDDMLVAAYREYRHGLDEKAGKLTASPEAAE
ncbi:dTDP-glucose 4,6-dehydratase [Cohaesibacter sp. ES.047]|uniref:NAD-dependent epimerase/dehydratase family protein n=1 Tax=Cohaesibacter sp. ES.047 TaxID=1798205 RepID=UPI000BB7CD6B|nr:NAD(P)-dependent oxidoreductase [Cohaesibacter sp. ES.047]SNY92629.1 dTDP-glucose 4,6-dehydratase [Cohaesibacter sp. ES.047]